jgi:hypothetical protein
MKGGNRFILRFAFRTVTERARPLETRSPCPTIANRHGSGEFAAKIQAHVIVTNSYRAGARVIVLSHFAKDARVFRYAAVLLLLLAWPAFEEVHLAQP